MSNWLKSKCPICDDEYAYTERFKPATCSKYECVHRYFVRKEGVTAEEIELFRWKQLNKLANVVGKSR
jgi:hypothetical protein